jgi:undecaprenyl diphosphate synthase
VSVEGTVMSEGVSVHNPAIEDFGLDAAGQAAMARILAVNPQADPVGRLPDVHPARLPRHIAVIMDGNGRWAQERGFPRIFGHRNGAAAVRTVIEECGRLGIEVLTLYSFSSENWNRPSEEVDALMYLAILYMEGERDAMVAYNMRFRLIGRTSELPEEVREAVERLEGATAACTGPMLCIAMNYGSRQEITDACRVIAQRVARGEVSPEGVDQSLVESCLYTAGVPDPDLLIRTAGEMRLSNYLLWQLSYAELHVTPVYWPDFGIEHLHEAIRDFASRERRFGGLVSLES